MKKLLKRLVESIAKRKTVRSVIANLVYPSIVDCLQSEMSEDVSPSGIAETIAWKTHAYIVLNEELHPTGQDCAEDEFRCDKETRVRLLDIVLPFIASIKGDILEFGVFKGESLQTFAERCPNRQVYGFDSFEGLPDDWWTRPKGTFKTDLPVIDKPNVTLVKGYFEESVPRFLENWSGRPALVHVDCVLYKSTMASLLPIINKCQIGTVVLFDEYYNYPKFAHHEWLAWQQIKARYGIEATCIAYDARRAAFQIVKMNNVTIDS